MIQRTGKAVVTITPHVVPIAYDGECSEEEISEKTVQAALDEFDWNPGYKGFYLADVYNAAVTMDDNDEEMGFRARSKAGLTYYFASKVLSEEEYRADPDTLWKDSDFPEGTVFYKPGERGTATLDEFDQKRTILIDRSGNQLWPPAKAL